MLNFDFFKAGGIVAYPLLGFSLLSVTLILERLVFWFTIKRKQNRVIKKTLKLYQTEPQVAIELLKDNANLPLARIFLEALSLPSPTSEEFRLALESAAQAEIPTLRRFSTIFQTIITVAPLLGLLGTILGLIRAFASLEIGNAPNTNTTGVTTGLSEALVSTVMGLVVAIFTLLFANSFRGLYLREIALIQEYGGQLELIYRRLWEKKTEFKN